MRKIAAVILCSFCALLLIMLCGCGSSVEYSIEVSGTAEQPGVVGFLGYSINVYKDQASNPCGDCADQPVHLFVGADAEAVINAIADVIERADDIWEVSEISENTVMLRLRDSGYAFETGSLCAPSGLALKSAMNIGGKTIIAESSLSGDIVPYNRASENDPQRIAAVYGPSYEMLTVLGAEDRIVLRADVQTDSFPWAEEVFSRISEIPALDNVHTAVNFEQLMSFSPDIVFTFPRQSELTQLAKAGIAAVEGETYSELGGVCDFLDIYAQALGGDAPKRSAQYRAYFEEKLESIRSVTQGIPESEKKRVYYAGADVLTTYGNQSDVPDAVRCAGGIPVSEEINGGNRVQINYEKLMEWNPEVIFLDHGGMNDGKTVEDIRAELEMGKQYAPITAVRENRIYTIPSGVFYWDMGLQKILLVEYMAKLMYPELFEGLDMEEELIDFYGRFYGYELDREAAGKILARQLP
ncbi:MAG: ABC transporter substrate-binding protein [Oscillospiraceae bacterium]|nr:ABC transporter substrate-binding protein [Oscillospiraceae bacterium]